MKIMKVIETGIDDLVIIEPAVFQDHRGYFYESYNQKVFKKLGLNYQFVQDNRSKSKYGTLRGLHYQINPHAQAKLVSVISGEVLDVAVDLRQYSATYGKYFSIKLNANNKKQLLVPRGFAHGFLVLSPEAEFSYKCDNFYDQKSEYGIIFNDPDINIDWTIPESDFILSDKDKELPSFKKAVKNFQK